MASRDSKDWKEERDDAQRFKPLTKGQELYFKAIETSTITIVYGLAGTGKSFCACGIAAQMLQAGRISKIIITRPLITCGGNVGYLPGDLDEKLTPYLRPLLDAMSEFFLPAELERLIKKGAIEMCPLEYMRGMSIKDAVVICDEAQNASYQQLRMLLTRIDKGTRLVIAGDNTQSDLNIAPLPLMQVISRFKKDLHAQISIVKLGKEDIVRSELISWIEERLNRKKKKAVS